MKLFWHTLIGIWKSINLGLRLWMLCVPLVTILPFQKSSTDFLLCSALYYGMMAAIYCVVTIFAMHMDRKRKS